LRLPLDSKMVRSAAGDCGGHHLGRFRRAPQSARSRGIEVLVLDGPAARRSARRHRLAGPQAQYLSLMIEAGSKVNWTALETGCGRPHFLLLRPKILGGLEALPLAGGIGRRRRADAIRVTTSPSTPFRPTSSRSKDTSMFTGIIEELGTVEARKPRAAGARLKVRCATCNGGHDRGRQHRGERRVPHRRRLRPDSFSADLAPETLRRSNLGDLRAGSRVNLERPLSPTAA
jgi:hypothetical protein